MKHKERLDVLLVTRNLAESRSKAQAMIMAGEVYVNEQKADKAGLEINIDDEPVVEVRGSACPYVSRGGLKLEKALRDFRVNPTGFVCSDSGASTGGFTDCLLQQGASKVFAIDVGYGTDRSAFNQHICTDNFHLCIIDYLTCDFYAVLCNCGHRTTKNKDK